MIKTDSSGSDSIRAPLIHIRPSKGWIGLDWQELWRFRELFGFLVWRDIKIKYKQTALGAAWAILVPLLQMFIFTFIFGKIAGLSSDGLPQPIFYFSGLIPWTYFATSVSMSSNSLVGNAQMVSKIYFPRMMVPTSPCLAGLLDFLIAFVILLSLMAIYGIMPAATIVFLPLLLLLALSTALGTGLLLSALNVKYRDIKYVVPFLIQIWMYMTAIIPFSSIPERFGAWRWLYGLNPMAGVVEGFRWCLLHPHMTSHKVAETVLNSHVVPETLAYGQNVAVNTLASGHTQIVLQQTSQTSLPLAWPLLVIGSVVGLGILLFGLFYFRRMERTFADIV